MKRKKETRGRPRTLTKRQYAKNQAAAQEKWRKEKMKGVSIRRNIESDADVISKLESVPNKADYIRRLIRADIVANGFDN